MFRHLSSADGGRNPFDLTPGNRDGVQSGAQRGEAIAPLALRRTKAVLVGAQGNAGTSRESRSSPASVY
jgi:hypothetical protein